VPCPFNKKVKIYSSFFTCFKINLNTLCERPTHESNWRAFVVYIWNNFRNYATNSITTDILKNSKQSYTCVSVFGVRV